MKNKKLLIGGSIVGLLVLFFGAVMLYKNKENERIAFLAQSNFSVFIRDHAPKIGALQPKVYLVEFFDPECETCREFYPLVKDIMKEHEGKIQLVMRYAPFHGNSIFAVKILEAARKQEKYWQALEVMYMHQPQWGNHHNPQPDLIWGYLAEIGLDLEKIKVDMNDPEIQKIIETDIKDGQTLGVRRTPQFFINGRALEQFGLDFLKAEIEKDL
jgi:protein-disulfide isomerase